MKFSNPSLSIIVLAIIASSCGDKKLDKETALTLIKTSYHYPYVLDNDIFCGDPVHAKRLMEAGLEAKGYVIVQHTQRLKDIGKSLVTFTGKSKPYLLPTNETDTEVHLQRIKIGEMDIEEIKSIREEKDRDVTVVEYTTVMKELTPFAAMFIKDPQKPHTHVIYFTLQDGKWTFVKKPDIF